MAAEVAAGAPAESRILKLAGGPNHVLGEQGLVVCIDAEPAALPGNLQHVGVRSNGNLEELRNRTQVLRIVFAGRMPDFQALRRSSPHGDRVDV